MSWTTSADLRAQVRRLWDQGDLLRACVTETATWPLRLTLKVPAPSDLADRFEAVRDWSAEIVRTPHVRFDWREWTHRVQGRQRLPDSAWIDSPRQAVDLIGHARQADAYRKLWQQTAAAQPALLDWLGRRPLKALEIADRWERMLGIVEWLQSHPRPAVYLRQVDAPLVDSKFIEAHRGVLTELLDLALPAEAIDTSAAGVAQFSRRFGFLDKPVRIRFRLLDPLLPSMPGCRGLADITLDAASFAALVLPVERVYITENEVNFLAFPASENAIVVFGAGYGWDALAGATWLHRCDLRYWGDIDTHGFAILDQLRARFPHTASFLMDRQTLFAHQQMWTVEPEPVRHDLARLGPDEASLYDDLRFDRIQPRLRFEQERIPYRCLSGHLQGMKSEVAVRSVQEKKGGNAPA